MDAIEKALHIVCAGLCRDAIDAGIYFFTGGTIGDWDTGAPGRVGAPAGFTSMALGFPLGTTVAFLRD